MLQDTDSSEEEDVEGSLFTGRPKKKSQAGITSTHSPEPSSFASFAPSLSLDTGESEAELQGIQGVNTLGEAGKLETDRRGSQQGSQRSSKSRSGSPLPDEQEGDFVIVSKGTRRASEFLFDWTMIDNRSGDELSDNEDEKDDESFELKRLYLLVARCIAYPFNAKYQIETTPPRPKLNAERFGDICRTLKVAVEDSDKILAEWEKKVSPQEKAVLRNNSFIFCLQWMQEMVLSRPEIQDVCNTGNFSIKELEAIFKVKATTVLTDSEKGLNSSDLTLWVNMFRKIVEQSTNLDFESNYRSKSPSAAAYAAVPKQNKLYKVFQQILKIRSIEHQVLYRECQLGNPEEQEAVVRKELQNRRKALLSSCSLVEGKFGSHKVEEIYREEQLKMLKNLNSNLDQLSLQGTGINTQAEKKKKKGVTLNESVPVTKQDLQFNLKVKVTIHEVMDAQSVYNGKQLFCVFGILDGGSDPLQTQPIELEYGGASFGEEGEFWVCSPIPQIKLELRSVSKGLFSDSKLVAKHVHTALPSSSDFYSTLTLYQSEKDMREKNEPVCKLRLSTIVERPTSIKKCGYLHAVGNSVFKQKKKRFFTLIQLSQYKFLFCSYQPNGTQPKETLLLDQGLMVEFASDDGQLSSEPDAKCFFDLVFEASEMGRIHFGCRDDIERQSWVEWMVRGTGQNFQPQQLGAEEVVKAGSNDLERHGLKEVVDSVNEISLLDPHKLFIKLFRATLHFRLEEDLFSRGLFSPAQMYVLDEFCARYGVRDPFRHLTCLQDWLDYQEQGVSIWPVMIQSSFRFCQMHVGGMNPPEKSVIVTTEEREVFVEVCQRIEEVVTYQLQNFRSYFPFSCPKGDLRTTLKLFDLVSTINHSSRSSSSSAPLIILIRTLEKAALVNYRQVYSSLDVSDLEKDAPLPITKVFDLAQLCIEFMYELHDFFWEEFNQTKVFAPHINAFWSFFLVDMREALLHDDDIILKLQLFHIVNHYFTSQPTMKLEVFHNEFLSEFTPVVIAYIDSLELTIKQELDVSLSQETWLPLTDKCCQAVEGLMRSLLSFKRFLNELNWPEESFAAYLDQKVAAICADRFQEAAEEIQVQFGHQIIPGKGSLSYTLPIQFFTMINTLVYLRSQVMQVCASQRIQINDNQKEESTLEHASTLNIEEHLSSILDTTVSMAIGKLCKPFEDILTRLTKFDPSEGFLASLKKLIPTSIPIDDFTEYLSLNLSLISTNLVPTIFNNFVVNWYECQMQLLSQWLDRRPDFSLQTNQLTSTENLVKTLYDTFVVCEIPPRQLRSDSYDKVQDRIRVENSHIDLLSIGKD